VQQPDRHVALSALGGEPFGASTVLGRVLAP
jgi:hypothetical protein